jgi:hypothetical protein
MLCSPKFRIRRFGRRTTGALTPALIAAVYELPQVPATRQPVVGILELAGGYRDSDNVAAFADMSQFVPAIANVSIGRAGNAPGDAADGEVALDIQVAGGVCQYLAGRQCRIVVAWAPNDGGPSFAAAIDALVDAGVDTISISWGAPEDQWTMGDRNAVGSAIRRASAAGIPVFVASGDFDSGDGEPGTNVDYPASDPDAIGCGGTTLLMRPGGSSGVTYASETVWNDGRGDGTGGGFSRYYWRPAWQTHFDQPMRGVPDVCGPADPTGPGWRVVLNGAVGAIGGTSAVAPFWAGIVAACKAAGYSGQDLAELLYANPGALRDTITGDNGGYNAAPGWDPCTGLGSPKGPALVKLLLGGTASSGSSDGSGSSSSSGSSTPTPPPPPLPPAVPTLAQAQAAAVEGIEIAVAQHLVFAPIIRLSEPGVRARLAALWKTNQQPTNEGESMSQSIEPRVGLLGILATIQASLEAVQKLLPVLQQVLSTIGQMPVGQPTSGSGSGSGSTQHSCCRDHCTPALKPRVSTQHSCCRDHCTPALKPRVDQSTISTDLANLQAAQATLTTDQTTLTSAQSTLATAQALVTSAQSAVVTDAASVAGLVRQTIDDITAMYGPPAASAS